MKKPLITVAICAALLASVVVAAPASAHNRSGPPPWTAGTPVTVTSGLVSPLSLDVAGNGVSYLTQNFAGLVTQVDQRGTASVIASAPGFETSAVSSRNGTVYYAVVAQDHSSAVLMARSRNGTVRQVADLWAHENGENPDSVNAYGFEGLTADCIAQFPAPGPMENPPAYTGIVDTHPYSSLALSDAIYVADAGANAIWRVGYDGTVTTVAVLPPTAPIFVTAELAEAFKFPACAAGHNYRFEPVPTDIELRPERLAVCDLAPRRSGGCEPGCPRRGAQGQSAHRRHRHRGNRFHRLDRPRRVAAIGHGVRRRTVRRREWHRPGLRGVARC